MLVLVLGVCILDDFRFLCSSLFNRSRACRRAEVLGTWFVGLRGYGFGEMDQTNLAEIRLEKPVLSILDASPIFL